MNILLANPRGFCAGVDRAILIVERAIQAFGPPIYVRHEVVHNRFVVERLRDMGAVFVDEIDEVPTGATVIFSAHGVAPSVRQAALERNLTVFDATCPLVTKVHMEVVRYSRRGEECILIGHRGHPEVEGTLGQYHNPEGGIYLVETETDVDTLFVKNPSKLNYVTQTTLSVDDTARIIQKLRLKFPAIHGPKTEDICYATQNRQDAVRRLVSQCDVLLVVGSQNSSNSNRLRELGDTNTCTAYLIDDAKDLKASWFTQAKTVGVTAGASAPEVLVQQVVTRLRELGGQSVQELTGEVENITFALPKALRRGTMAADINVEGAHDQT